MTTSGRRSPAVLLTVAVVMTSGGLMFGTGAIPGDWLDAGRSPNLTMLSAGCLISGLAEFARLRVRVGAAVVELAWSEAAFIMLCHFLPAGWIPATVLVGVCGAHTVLGLLDQRRTACMILRATATLTVSASIGVLVTRAIADTYGHPFSPPIAVALLFGSLVHALTAMYLAARQLDGAVDGDASAVFRRLLSGKLLMLLGNIAVGLIVVAVDGPSRRWLVLLLPPVAWLLQQAYGYRLRLDDERWTWKQFADVTGKLNRLDERDAAEAGIRGALRLFPAMAAEVVVFGEDGTVRTYAGQRGGEVATVPAGEPVERVVETVESQPVLAGWRRPLPIEPRRLYVGGTQIGELRLRLARPVRFSRRDRHMLAAYSDALAAALHDAATHQELRSIAERSMFEAVHDPLTGVLNRAALLTLGSAALRRLPPGTAVALLLLDIDHFKEVNNALGHAAGDALLQVVARRLGATLGEGELLARLGGDEFAILMTAAPGPAGDGAESPDGVDRDGPGPRQPEPVRTGAVEPEWTGAVEPAPAGPEPAGAVDSGVLLCSAVDRARGLADQVATPTEVCGVVLSVEASIGVVADTAGTVGLTELLRRADVAMYQAKRGTQPVAWYEPARDEASVDRLTLLAEVRTALARRDQLTIVLQPAVALDTGRPVGVEVLVRWEHPRRGLLMPGDFLDTVEHSELVGAFTRYVLERALELAGQWSVAGIDTPIAVNLSARSLLDRTLAEDLPKLLDQHGVPPDRLTLEITESVVLTELPVVEEVLASLRAIGVRLAVDDFGSGFSSLTFLTRVPVDEVKIDQAFVARMVDSVEAEAIVRTTVDLGRQLGLRVVAEGVETAAQRAALRSLGCVAAQGYHFYHPLPPERAAVVLMRGGADPDPG